MRPTYGKLGRLTAIGEEPPLLELNVKEQATWSSGAAKAQTGYVHHSLYLYIYIYTWRVYDGLTAYWHHATQSHDDRWCWSS